MQIVSTFLFLAFAISAHAKELTQFGEDTRSYGMGGVRIFREDDASGFLWNPASLGFTSGMNWRVMNVDLGLNGVQAYNDFKDVNVSGLNSLSGLYGKHLWVGYQGYSAFTVPYFGIGVYGQGTIDSVLRNPAYPQLDLTYINDYAVMLGWAFPVGPGASAGINFKRVTRFGGPQVIGTSVLNSSSLSGQQIIDQFTNEGNAYGADLGLMYRLPVPMNPTLSVAWQDVGATTFKMSKGSAAPPRIEDNLTLAATFSGELPGLGLSGGLEYRHVRQDTEPLGKKLHMGLELNLLMLDLRAGFYQGYTTYGASMDLWLFQLDAASYSVERGAYPGQTPDARIQVSISAEFGLDPDFKITDGAGKKRKLKKRR